jgi:hypothetical protein
MEERQREACHCFLTTNNFLKKYTEFYSSYDWNTLNLIIIRTYLKLKE